MKINSIDNSQRQSFGMLKYAPEAQKLLVKTAKESSSSEWVNILTDISNAIECLKNTKYGDVIVDIKNNDYSKPACLVFLVALTTPVLKGMEIIKEMIPGPVLYSATPERHTTTHNRQEHIANSIRIKRGEEEMARKRVLQNMGDKVFARPYDSIKDAINAVKTNEERALSTETTMQQQIEEQKRADREKEERRLQEMRKRDERKQQELRETQERKLRAAEEEEKNANKSKIAALLEKLGF